MNCQQVHDKIEGYYEGVLPLGDEWGIDIHLVQCPNCQSELGGIHGVVHECHAAFDALPDTQSSDLHDLHQGIELLEQKALAVETNRIRFFRKEQLLRLILIGVTIPTLFILGNKAVDTYTGYDAQYESTQQHYQHQQAVPDYISRDAVSLDW